MNEFIESVDYGQRIEVFHKHLDKNISILEIGPSHSPIAPKRDGFKTDIVDAMDEHLLKEKYEKLGVESSAIEKVDYVWTSGGIKALVSKKYDHIIASHVIEHIPDPVTFLKDCESILTEDGRLHLAVPDATRCFDFLRPFSTAGQMLLAHHEKRSRHSPAVVYDFYAMFAQLGGLPSWFDTADRSADIQIDNSATFAFSQLNSALTNDSYHDVHGWVFTPYSFLLILYDIYELGLLPLLRLEKVFLTTGHEFHVIFNKSSSFVLQEAMNKKELWRKNLNYLASS